MNLSKLLLPITLVSAMCFSGCGGSGTSNTLLSTKPKLQIEWPDVSRGVRASKYARSARISVTPSDSEGRAVSWTVDRPTSSAASNLVYTGPNVEVSGPVAVSVQFYATGGGQGAIVSTAVFSATMLSDGTVADGAGSPLGSIASTGTLGGISSALVSSSGAVVFQLEAGSSAKVLVTGWATSDSFRNSPIALDQELISKQVQVSLDTGSGIAVANGANITGVKEGLDSLTVSLNGLTSNSALTVTPRAVQARSLGVVSNGIAYDPSRNGFWCSFGSGTVEGNSIALVNPVTGLVTNRISLGTSVSHIAVSGDGTLAYVWLPDTRIIQIINLVSGTLGAAIPMPPSGGDPVWFSVNPLDSKELSVSMDDRFGYPSPRIIRDSTLLPDSPTNYSERASLASYSPSGQLIGISRSDPTNPALIGVNSTGCFFQLGASYDSTSEFLFSKSGPEFMNGNAIFGNGRIVQVSDLANRGRLRHPLEPTAIPIAVAADATAGKMWTLVGASSGAGYNLRVATATNNTFEDAVRLTGVSGGQTMRMMRYGAKSLVLWSNNGLYVVDSAPGL